LGDQAVSDLWEAGLLLGGDAAVSLALAIGNQGGPGRNVVSPRANAGASAGPAGPGRHAHQQSAPPAAAGLAVRERQIADLIASGASNKAIADALVITPATAARHVANIMGKLGFNSRAQIAAWTVNQTAN